MTIPGFEDGFYMIHELPTEDTGLPMVIYVDDLGIYHTNKNIQPRIFVCNTLGSKRTGDIFIMSLSKRPKIVNGNCKLSDKDLKTVKRFISNHYYILMAQWNDEIDEDELDEILETHRNEA